MWDIYYNMYIIISIYAVKTFVEGILLIAVHTINRVLIVRCSRARTVPDDQGLQNEIG